MIDKELVVLYDRMVDGRISNDQARLMQKLLAKKPEARRQLAYLLVLEGGLDGYFHEERARVAESGLHGKVTSPRHRPLARSSPRRNRRRSRSMSRPLLFAGVLGALCLCVLLLYTWNRSLEPLGPVDAQLAQVTTMGAGQWQDVNGNWQPAHRATAIPTGTALRGPVLLDVQGAGRFTFAKQAQATFVSVDHVALGLGRVDVVATPRDKDLGKQLRVTTPHGEVAVLGTSFTVTVAADSTRCQVQEGLVALRSQQGLTRQLQAGDDLSVQASGAFTTVAAVASGTVVVLNKNNAAAFLGTEQRGRVVSNGLRPVAHDNDGKQVSALTGDMRPLGLQKLSRHDVLTVQYSSERPGTFWVVLVVHDAAGRWLGNWQVTTELPAANQGSYRMPLDGFRRLAGSGELQSQQVHAVHIGWPADRLEEVVLHEMRWSQP